MERYGVDRSDLLLWVQHLMADGEFGPVAIDGAAPQPTPVVPPDRLSVPEAAGRPLPIRTWTTGMIDGPTGAGTVLALHRDVLIERSSPVPAARRFVLAVAAMEPKASGAKVPAATVKRCSRRSWRPPSGPSNRRIASTARGGGSSRSPA